MAKSVAFIRMNYREYHSETSTHTDHLAKGSGVFINKGGDYTSPKTDKPLLLTARHIFVIELSDGTKLDLLTLKKGQYSRSIYVQYMNDVCNSTKRIAGKSLGGDFEVLEHGDAVDSHDANYNDSDDFALL